MRTKRFVVILIYTLLFISLEACSLVSLLFRSDSAIDFSTGIPAENVNPQAELKLDIILVDDQAILSEVDRLDNIAKSRAKPLDLPASSYKVGAKDVLNIMVWDHPELNISNDQKNNKTGLGGRVVADDGTIFYPQLGRIKVAGLSVDDIRELLTNRLAKYIENPQLDVSVSDFRSKKVYLVGEVDSPGLQPITNNSLTVIEAVSNAGGLTDEADLSSVTLSRQQVLYKIDLRPLFEQGDMSRNIILKNEDIFNVPNILDNKIYVVGEVKAPGIFVLSTVGKTLAEAVMRAGGTFPEATKTVYYFVVRGTEDEPKIFQLNTSLPGALFLANNFALISGDIIYVTSANFLDRDRVYNQLLEYSGGTRLLSKL